MVTTRVIPSALGIRDDLLVVWRGMEDPPPKLPWPGEDVEVEEYTSPPPHETKTISIRFLVPRQGPGGCGRGDDAACARLAVVAHRYSIEGYRFWRIDLGTHPNSAWQPLR
jgi:hypothetical protein